MPTENSTELNQPVLNALTPTPPLTSTELAERRAKNIDVLSGILEPVKNRRQAIEESRASVLRRLEKYRKQLEAKCQANLRAGEVRRFRSVEEFIHSRILRAAPDTDPEVLKKPPGDLYPFLKRFDWRALQIVPEVAKQTDNTCWAETATATFESSLRRQRANFSTRQQGEQSFKVEEIRLDVDSTLDRVAPFREVEASGGRHENAFNFYFNEGIPLSEIQIREQGLRVLMAPSPGASTVEPPPQKKPRTAKAIAWNYVANVELDDLTEPPSVEALKSALLEHGPLAVMVARDETFKNYGRPAAEQKAPPKVSLRFRANTFVEVISIGSTSDVLLNVRAIDFLQSDSVIPHFDQPFEQELVLNFKAEHRPVVETNSSAPIPLRAVGADQAVPAMRDSYRSLNLCIPGINGVVCETVSIPVGMGIEHEYLLHFPANTNMEFKELEGGGLQLRFPKDEAPVFAETTEDRVNHYVLLIGWDDTKGPHGAWIIQNHQGNEWGYQCDGPAVRGWSPMPDAGNRGYMYIGYGCNQIGAFAAWIEARFLSQSWIGAMLKRRS